MNQLRQRKRKQLERRDKIVLTDLSELTGWYMSLPTYTVEEMIELSDVVEQFNESQVVRGAWDEQFGRLELETREGNVFWFTSSSRQCQMLADLAVYNGSTYRAKLQHDGRVSLTGWCEQWYYSAMTNSLRLVS